MHQNDNVIKSTSNLCDDVWSFRQAISAQSLPHPADGAKQVQADLELLEWAASISSDPGLVQRAPRKCDSDSTSERQLLEWLVTISPKHEIELHSVLIAEARARTSLNCLNQFAECLDLQEAQWDPAKHPRRGGPPNAGWFATTGGAPSGAKSSSIRKPTGVGATGAISKSVGYTRGAAPNATRYDTMQLQNATSDSTTPAAFALHAGPKRALVHQVSVRRGIGHHWAPKAVVFDNEIRSLLTDEAAEYAMGAYSGPTDPSHNYGTYGGVTHREYNAFVKDELKKFIESRKIKKMTVEQMQEFINLVDNGLDAFGAPHAQIAAFNNAIKRAIPNRSNVPKRVEDIIAAGRKYMKHPRFRLLVAGAIVSGLLSDIVAQQVDVLDVAAQSGHYKRAMQALDDGDLAQARRLLVGDRESLYMEILVRVGAHAALNFKAAMEKVFAAAHDRAYN
jgi:hypothetical protein